MHRNLYWRTAEGWQLDGGAYVAGLEEATGRRATICGKPSAAYFEEALRLLGVAAEETVMVGDDLVNDVLGAQGGRDHGGAGADREVPAGGSRACRQRARPRDRLDRRPTAWLASR